MERINQMPTMDKLSSYKTTITGDGEGNTLITYQATVIVKFSRDTVTLNSGGWDTVTTKRKMNQASYQFNLGYSVTQREFKWFVTLPSGKTVTFVDGMTFKRED